MRGIALTARVLTVGQGMLLNTNDDSSLSGAQCEALPGADSAPGTSRRSHTETNVPVSHRMMPCGSRA
jgi:hypothetical protein